MTELNAVPPGNARRRYLTVLFSDLSDSTKLAAAMEAEDYAGLLGRLRHTYQDVIPKHGGTMVRIQGDGMLAIFGYPDAREDDGRRAAEAALELHDRVRRLRFDPPLPGAPSLALHTGIHSGLVLLGEGDDVRGRFELLGNAPNIAARLSDLAEKDEILVSEETLGAELNFFQRSERRSLRLKGKIEPVSVYRIHARAPVNTRLEARAQRGLAPFVGRQAELAVLLSRLEDALSGKPGYVAIAAPAGLGKTRLIDEFLRRAAAVDCQIHRGYCESYLSAEPLQPFLQMLRSLCGLSHGMSAILAAEALEFALSAIDPALLHYSPELLRLLSLSAARPQADPSTPPAVEDTIAALRGLFDALAAAKPLVLVIDDWQWADDATRQVLGAISVLDQRAILVLVATRGFAAGDAGMSAARILELAPFTEQETAETIVRLLPGTDPFLVTEIRKYSGGNPLFIEELCHSAAYEDTDRRIGRAHSGAAWLNSLIESRVARLPDAQADLVRTAAIIGNVIPCWLLESITGCGERHPLVRGLAEQDFAFPGEQPGTLRFKHGITRDVIYDSVGLHQRRAMHLRIAESLREHGAAGGLEELYEALAYHYGAGGQAADAALYAERAGDKAMAASALDRAQSQYQAALAALDLLEPSDSNYRRWIAIVQKLALACVFDPSREALEVLRRAVARAAANDDQAAVAGAEFWLGNINYALGESRVATAHCERALMAASRVGDQRLIVEIRTTLGHAAASACDYDRSLGLLDEAIELKRRHRSGARPAVGLSYTLTCKASVLGDRGLFGQAHECLDEALDAMQSANHAVKGSLFCWRSAIYLWQGRWEDARLSALEAQQVAERGRSFYLYAMGRALEAYASWTVGRAPEALQTMVDATSWLEVRDRGQYTSLNYGWLADALVASGRFQEARNHAARALLRARKYDRLGKAMACRAMARASVQGHMHGAAQHYLALAMNAARVRGSPHEFANNQLCQAEIALALGERAQARALLEQAGMAFSAMDMAWHATKVTELLRCL
jgi:class 3 adenylate cyclase/tetratricopeptide (TPR) repeat protein